MHGSLVSDVAVDLYVSHGSINGVSTLQLSGTIKDERNHSESHSTASIGSASGNSPSTLLGIYSRGNHDSVAISCLPDTVLASK